MESLFLILPIAISIGACLTSVVCFRKLHSKISSLEQALLAHASDPSGHGRMPMIAPTAQYAMPQGYGYQYYPTVSDPRVI
jgi:hypothetical protein